MRKFLMIASAVAVTSVTPALAADHTWQVGPDAFNVRLNDLDLRLATGRAEALARVEAAAAKLCRRAGSYAARKDCRADVMTILAQRGHAPFIQLAMAERAQAGMRLARAK